MRLIASHTRNFIFIKTQKTGGTSVEIALSVACSGRDIVTTISPEDEILRRDLGGQPRNFTDDPKVEHRFFDAVRSGDISKIDRIRKRDIHSLYSNHMTAMEVRTLLPELWQKAFKFTIERHPYDRAVSMAWWRVRGIEDKFASALDAVPDDPTFPNHRQYFDGKNVLVDRVIEYNRLAEELADISRKLGFKATDLPRAKGSFRKDKRPADDVLTAKLKARIYDVTAPEFEIMGYRR